MQISGNYCQKIWCYRTEYIESWKYFILQESWQSLPQVIFGLHFEKLFSILLLIFSIHLIFYELREVNKSTLIIFKFSLLLLLLVLVLFLAGEGWHFGWWYYAIWCNIIYKKFILSCYLFSFVSLFFLFKPCPILISKFQFPVCFYVCVSFSGMILPNFFNFQLF